MQLAHKIHSIIGRPSTKDYKFYVANNYMVGCPISFVDVNADEDIFGKDDIYLQGNTMWSKPHKFHSVYINIYLDLMYKYQSVTLSDDFVFVNGISFFVAISQHIKFIMAMMTKYQRIKPLIENVKEVKEKYYKHGFHIGDMQMDRKF